MNAVTLLVRLDGSLQLEYYVTQGTSSTSGCHKINPEDSIASLVKKIKGLHDVHGSSVNVLFKPSLPTPVDTIRGRR